METPNMSYIQSMSGGNKEFEKKLVDIIKSEFPTERQVYTDNISNKNYKLAAENVHKLKHKISILGLEKSYEVAVSFENNLLEDKSDLQDEFESILTTISDYLQKL